MTDRVQQVRNRASDGVERWQANVVLPYANAYVTAYEGYQAAMKAQAEADKARAELFVAVAGILSGSLLMATVAQTSIRAVAGNALLSFVCNRNLTRTFEVMAIAADNRPFMFALGKVLDTIKDRTSNAIKERATQEFGSGVRIQTSNPQVKQNELLEILLRSKLAAIGCAETIERSPVPEGTKARLFGELMRAPICNAPTGRINEVLLSKQIELGFYLKAVLDSDRLTTIGPAIIAPPGVTPPRSSSDAPIPYAPSDPRYPRPAAMDPFRGGQTITFDGIGSAVESRLDRLHRELFQGQPFRAERPWNPFGGGPTPAQLLRQELVLAERRLDELSARLRPTQVLQVRS